MIFSDIFPYNTAKTYRANKKQPAPQEGVLRGVWPPLSVQNPGLPRAHVLSSAQRGSCLPAPWHMRADQGLGCHQAHSRQQNAQMHRNKSNTTAPAFPLTTAWLDPCFHSCSNENFLFPFSNLPRPRTGANRSWSGFRKTRAPTQPAALA